MDKGKYRAAKATRMTINGKEIGITPHEQERLRKSLDDAILTANRKHTQTANVPTGSDYGVSVSWASNETPPWLADLMRVVRPPKVLLYRHPAVDKGMPVAYIDEAYNVVYIHPEDFDALSESTGVVESTPHEYKQFLEHMYKKRIKGILGDSYFGENSPK